MPILPSLIQMSPGLNTIFNQLDLTKDSADLLKAKNLIKDALPLYKPEDLNGNDQTINDLNSASKLLENLSQKETETEENLSLLSGYLNMLAAGMFFYRGQWNLALNTIKKSQSSAIALVKKEKSARNLFFQAEIKALSARMQLFAGELDKAFKLLDSSLRLYKQALKQKDGSLQEAIISSFQRKALQYGDIHYHEKETDQALSLYLASFDSAKDSLSSSLFEKLMAACSDSKEILQKLLEAKCPKSLPVLNKQDASNAAAADSSDKPAASSQSKTNNQPVKNSEEGSHKKSEQGIEASLWPLYLARTQALLVYQNPDFEEIKLFFTSLYFLLEDLIENQKEKVLLDPKEILSLCSLIKAYQKSDLYTTLLKQDTTELEDPEKKKGDLSKQVQAFNFLASILQSPSQPPAKSPYSFSFNPIEEEIQALIDYYDNKEGESEKDLNADIEETQQYQADTYLFKVALVIHCDDTENLGLYLYRLYDFCLSAGGTNYENEQYPQALFYDEIVLQTLDQGDPLDLLTGYHDRIDFYQEVSTLYAMCGDYKNSRKYNTRAEKINDELYDKYGDDDDYMFR